MKLADRQIIQRLGEIYDAQAAGGAASFAELTGSPSDNAALDSALDAKGPAPSDEAYDATTWNGVTDVAPSKNAVRDKIEAVVASIPTAPSGGVIGTAQVVVTAGTSIALSHPFGVLASGITPTYASAGVYIITKSTDFADDGRDFRVGVTPWGVGTPYVVMVENNGPNEFRISTFDLTGSAVEVDRFMISVETVSQ